MPLELDIDLEVVMPDIDKDVEAVVEEALRAAIEEANRNLRTGGKSWRDQSGTLSASFHTRDVPGGAQLINHARYSGAVVEFKGAPPLGVLVWTGIQELAAKHLEERGDEIALAALRDIMQPLIDEARRSARGR